MLRILNTGAQWHMFPQCYPTYKTVYRRILLRFQHEVLRESFIDATPAAADG